jgi:recombinational DNA repair protein (RecF pathway)
VDVPDGTSLKAAHWCQSDTARCPLCGKSTDEVQYLASRDEWICAACFAKESSAPGSQAAPPNTEAG